MPEETQCSEPVVDRHHHRIPVAYQIAASVKEDRTTARGEASAVDEEEDGPRLPLRLRSLTSAARSGSSGSTRSRKTILAVGFGRLRIRRARDARHRGGLWGDRAEGRCVPYLAPVLGRGGRQRSSRWGPCIGDARERPMVFSPDTPEPSLSDGNDSIRGSSAGAVVRLVRHGAHSVSSTRPSNRACDFPAHGSPTVFSAWLRRLSTHQDCCHRTGVTPLGVKDCTPGRKRRLGHCP